jgi:hypothetical protein
VFIVFETQDQALAQVAGIGQQRESIGMRQMLVRNSRILVGLTFLGSVASFCISLCLAVLACSSLFPLRAITFDRIAIAFLWSLCAWVMAMAHVFLWRQGRLMAYCSVLLDNYGVHFRLDGTRDSKEIFLPWNGIAAVRHKRIPKVQKVTVLGADTSTVTFTSYSFYRPRKVARLIAARAGLPLLRG